MAAASVSRSLVLRAMFDRLHLSGSIRAGRFLHNTRFGELAASVFIVVQHDPASVVVLKYGQLFRLWLCSGLTVYRMMSSFPVSVYFNTTGDTHPAMGGSASALSGLFRRSSLVSTSMTAAVVGVDMVE